jgi:hypothetical protein
MCGMMHRLDPTIPLVWRDQHTLQLGVERVVCVFPEPTTATERMLAALRTGAPLSALEVEAAGTAEQCRAEATALLTSVADALLPQNAQAEPRPIVLDGDGPTAERMLRLLRQAGHRVITAAAVEDDEADAAAAVLLASYVIPPWRHGPWLRRDVPHLPVVFDDDGAELGPFVDSDGPCLRCVSLHRTDSDPAWPAIAAQLAAHDRHPEPELLSAQVAAIAARLVDARVRAGAAAHAATSIRVHADGSISRRAHSPHAACGCRALPENVTALVGRRRSQPSSAPADASHA